MSQGWTLGVDFGTTNTVAVLGAPDWTSQPLLFDGSPLLPSAVCALPSGELLVGQDALRAGRMYPELFEPNPKRRIDDGVIVLGDREYPVPEVVAAVLRTVLAAATAATGGTTPAVILAHPVAWGPRRRQILLDGAALAGVAEPRLVPEPVAAASYQGQVAGGRPDGPVLVYDCGAGTFDATLVRLRADGPEVIASAGLPDSGGLDVDAAVMSYLAAIYAARDPQAWRQIEQPADPAQRRVRQQLWRDVRAAKEMLSRTSQATIHLPMLDADAPLGREQLEQLAKPVLDRTVATTRALLADAGVTAAELVAVLLVGGGSRLPLVATMLHRALGVAPTCYGQPELVVAEGSLRAASALTTMQLAADPGPAHPPPGAPTTGALPGAPFVPPQEPTTNFQPVGTAAAVPGGWPPGAWPPPTAVTGGGYQAPTVGPVPAPPNRFRRNIAVLAACVVLFVAALGGAAWAAGGDDVLYRLVGAVSARQSASASPVTPSGTPSQSASPTPAPVSAAPSSAAATPSRTPSRPPATRSPTPTPRPTVFPENVAQPCAGRPTADQVIAVARKSSSVSPTIGPLVAHSGPVCAGNWQYTVLEATQRPDLEYLHVVTKGPPTGLVLFDLGTDICSPDLRAAAPSGIVVAAGC